MKRDFLYSIKDLSTEDKLLVCYYLYCICNGLEDIENGYEIEALYEKLVTTLELESHSKKVIEAIIEKHKKTGLLTVKGKNNNYENPFSRRIKLKNNYNEDEYICNKARWNTDTEEEINLVRAIFASKNETEELRKIIKYTFFYYPDENQKSFVIPENFEIPQKIIKYSKNTKKVNYIIKILKLSKEEGLLLNIAYFATAVKECYDLDSYSVKKEESELALRLLKNCSNTNLLLYGAHGSGKTEYARTLAIKAGLTPYVFMNELEVEDKNVALQRLNCLLSIEKKDSVIIVDEAENILSTRMNFFGMFTGGSFGNSKKGIVNNMLEKSVNKVIWIVNYTKTFDESTLRRFTYSIHFNQMTKAMIQNIASSKLNKIKMSQKLQEDLVQLCGKYQVTGASIDNIVKTVNTMDVNSEDEAHVVDDVQKVLKANSTLL